MWEYRTVEIFMVYTTTGYQWSREVTAEEEQADPKRVAWPLDHVLAENAQEGWEFVAFTPPVPQPEQTEDALIKHPEPPRHPRRMWAVFRRPAP